jgi:hypothetical protein
MMIDRLDRKTGEKLEKQTKKKRKKEKKESNPEFRSTKQKRKGQGQSSSAGPYFARVSLFDVQRWSGVGCWVESFSPKWYSIPVGLVPRFL